MGECDTITDFSWEEIKIIIKIKNLINHKETTISNIAKDIQISITHPYLYKILRYLMDKEAIVVNKIIGNTKLLKINYKKIKNVLDEQEEINFMVDNYISKDHKFLW